MSDNSGNICIKNSKVLFIYYQNVRGLNTKLTDVYNSLASCHYDVVAFTETFLSETVQNSEISGPNYVIYRSDRKYSSLDCERGGGVLLAVDSNLRSHKYKLDSLNFSALPVIDVLVVKICMAHGTLNVIVVYVPPAPRVSAGDVELFFELLSSLCSLLGNNIIILGDFNIPSYSAYLVNSQLKDSKTNSLLYFLNLTNYHQYNYITNNYDRLLDLVLSDKQCVIVKASDVLLNEDAHHPSLEIETNCLKLCHGKYLYNGNFKTYNFRKADFYQLYSLLLNTDWSFITSCTDVDIACFFFYSKLNNIIVVSS